MAGEVIPFLSTDIIINSTKLVVGRELLSPTKTQVGPVHCISTTTTN